MVTCYSPPSPFLTHNLFALGPMDVGVGCRCCRRRGGGWARVGGGGGKGERGGLGWGGEYCCGPVVLFTVQIRNFL